jgi:hypothetical protein
VKGVSVKGVSVKGVSVKGVSAQCGLLNVGLLANRHKRWIAGRPLLGFIRQGQTFTGLL